MHSLHKAGKAGISKTKVRAIETLSKAKGLTQKQAQRLLGRKDTAGEVISDAVTVERLDQETVEFIADGGEDFRNAIYDAAKGDAITSYNQIDDAVQTIDDLSGVKRQRAKQLIRDTDGAGIRLLSDLDETVVHQLTELDVDTNGYDVPDDLADKVRVSLARSYGFGHVKREEIGKIVDDIETLESSDKVEGVPSALDGSGSGAGPPDGLTNIGTGMFAYVQFKGAAYELRVARKLLDDGTIADGDVLKMDYQPDVDFTELSDDQIQDIADKVYEGDISKARSALGVDSDGKQPQFDGFKISSDSGQDVYYEMKNTKRITKTDIQKKGTFMLAYNKLSDSDINVGTMRVYIGEQDGKLPPSLSNRGWLEKRDFPVGIVNDRQQ